MARAMWKGAIQFGLVTIPIKLYLATESKGISFNMLHKTCGSRLKQQYICTKDGEIVPRDATVKGYEFSKGQYVVLSAEEIKALEEKATGAIDILEFVPLSKVERVYLEKVYYIGPDKGGDRAYRLLADRNVNAPAGTFYAYEPARRLGLDPDGGLRIGLAPYTDDDDVDRLLAGITAFLA